MEQERIIVAGMNEASLTFIRQLNYLQLPYLVLTNNKQEEKRLLQAGAQAVYRVNTNHSDSCGMPEVPVGEVYIFEISLALSCRYVRCCRPWTLRSVYIITQQWNPRAIYTGLGANHVIYTHAAEVGFLLRERGSLAEDKHL